MTLLGLQVLTQFIAAHAHARKPLESWRTLIERNAFAHFVALKQAFAAVDYVPPDTVFDLGGNKYRLIALVNFQVQVVQIKHVFTHAQYDEWSGRRSKKKGKSK